MTSQPERVGGPSPVTEPVKSAKDPAAAAPAADSTVPAADSAAPAAGSTAPPVLPHHKIRRTRISGAWVAMIGFAVVLLLLLIFILQNSRTVDVSYFGAHGHLPLGVALLLAAVGGVLLVALAGGARIVQLRRTARRHRRADAAAQPQNPAASAGRA